MPTVITFLFIFLAIVRGLDVPFDANRRPSNKLKGGQLVLDGKQTACGLAVIDSKAAVVAADCINASSLSQYSVYLDMGITGTAENYTVESITIHPDFNSSSLANNIAVLQYNSQSNAIAWQNTLGVINVSFTGNLYLIDYGLLDIDSMTWDEAGYLPYGNFAEPTCKSYSALYKANMDYFLCSGKFSGLAVSSVTNCEVPCHTMYFLLDNTMYLAALMSYSTFYEGTDFCSAKLPRMYYTLLGPYIGFLKSIIQRDIKVALNTGVDEQQANALINNADFQMNQFAGSSDYNAIILHGDFFNNKNSTILPTEPDPSTPLPDDLKTNSQTTSSVSMLSETTNSNTEATNSNSVVKGAIIGVCIGVAGLAAICSGLYFWLWKRKHKPGVADPMRNNDFQNMLETSRPIQANVGDYHIDPLVDYDLPPIYEEVPNK